MNAIKARLAKFQTTEEFVAGYGHYFFRGGMLLPTRQPREEGSELTLQIQIATGENVLRGMGVVQQIRRNAEGETVGMVIRFTKLDTRSKQLVDQILDARRELRATGAVPVVTDVRQAESGASRVADQLTGQHLGLDDIDAIAEAVDKQFDAIFTGNYAVAEEGDGASGAPGTTAAASTASSATPEWAASMPEEFLAQLSGTHSTAPAPVSDDLAALVSAPDTGAPERASSGAIELPPARRASDYGVLAGEPAAPPAPLPASAFDDEQVMPGAIAAADASGAVPRQKDEEPPPSATSKIRVVRQRLSGVADDMGADEELLSGKAAAEHAQAAPRPAAPPVADGRTMFGLPSPLGDEGQKLARIQVARIPTPVNAPGLTEAASQAADALASEAQDLAASIAPLPQALTDAELTDPDAAVVETAPAADAAPEAPEAPEAPLAAERPVTAAGGTMLISSDAVLDGLFKSPPNLPPPSANTPPVPPNLVGGTPLSDAMELDHSIPGDRGADPDRARHFIEEVNHLPPRASETDDTLRTLLSQPPDLQSPPSVFGGGSIAEFKKPKGIFERFVAWLKGLFGG